jgi:hypothetical protein
MGTTARRRIARRWIALAVVVVVVAAAAVCWSLLSSALNRPSFRAPVEWGALAGDRAERDGTNVPTTVRLLADGRAQLTNFPQGVDGTESGSYGTSYTCLQVSTSTRYTGIATWSAPDAGEFILRFGKSSVEVAADTDGYIGRTPDWDFVWILECDSGAVEWTLGYSCGDAGGGDAGRLDIPCRKE